MRNQIRWKDIEYQPGYCEAIARAKGKIVARHRIETTGKPVKLVIESDNANWKADGTDLQHLRIIAIDSKCRRVATAPGEVRIKITGDATIAAMSNGNISNAELAVTDRQSLFNGSCLAILRSGMTPSQVTITAECEGMKSAKIKLMTK
jgi:beta-galactosidase